MLAGNIEWGTEGGLFLTPCGESAAIRMEDPEGMLERAGSFVSVHAVPRGKGGKDGWIVVGINYMPGEGFDCSADWNAFLWRASGNEPFWSAEVGEDGLTLRTPEGPSRVLPVRVEEGPTFIADAREVTLRFLPGPCADTMSDTVYGYRVEFTQERKVLWGCGYQGLAAEPLK